MLITGRFLCWYQHCTGALYLVHTFYSSGKQSKSEMVSQSLVRSLIRANSITVLSRTHDNIYLQSPEHFRAKIFWFTFFLMYWKQSFVSCFPNSFQIFLQGQGRSAYCRDLCCASSCFSYYTEGVGFQQIKAVCFFLHQWTMIVRRLFLYWQVSLISLLICLLILYVISVNIC